VYLKPEKGSKQISLDYRMLLHALRGTHHQPQSKAPLVNSCNNSSTTQCYQLDKLASNLGNLKTLQQVEWMLLVGVAENAAQHIQDKMQHSRCDNAALTSSSG
jgi:hypothetical protein